MAISFNNIPGNLRVPLAYFEIDPSQAASYQEITYALLLGTHDPTRGPLEVNRLTRIRSPFDADGQCGVGSALARAAGAYFRNNQSVPLWIIAAPETGYTAGVGRFEVGGDAMQGGTIPLYIGGRLIRVYVSAGMSDEDVVEAMVEAINTDPAIGATATATAGGGPAIPTAATLRSGSFLTAGQGTLLSALQAISDGAFAVSVSGASRDTGEIDFAGAATLAACAALIQTALAPGITFAWNAGTTGHFSLSTTATGEAATLDFAGPPADGTDISGLLFLTAATGASLQQGAAGSANPRAVVTSINPGVAGELSLAVAYRGPAYGEIIPAGLTVTAFPMTGANGVPNLDTLLSNLGDELFDYISCPWSDGGSLDALSELFNDITGRWSWQAQLYGHAFAYRDATFAALATFGNTRNDQHVTVGGMDECPAPPCEISAAWTGQCAGSLVVDPARPVQSLPLLGILPPPAERRFDILDRQTLYFDGIACTYVDAGGIIRIDRSITTYQRNVWGAPDNSYLDVETLFTLAYFNRFMRQRILTKFPRHKLANDDTRFGAGQAIVTPAIIRSEMIAAYGELEVAGIMENMTAFKANLIIERNAQDPNRVDALLPPDLVNQLRIFAALTQFKLRTISVEAA